jgi:S1-C subfamily serine protease
VVNISVQRPAAAQAGILQGDLLLRFGGEPVNSVNQAIRHIARTRPGERLQIRVRRMKNVREEDITATLAEASEK